MRFGQAKESVVEDVKGHLEVSLILPVLGEEGDDSFDVFPVFDDVFGVVLEQALNQGRVPFQNLLIGSLQVNIGLWQKLPFSGFIFLSVLETILS